MLDLLTQPWPWYLGGPLFGLLVPLLLLANNRSFGISGSYRPLCAIGSRGRVAFFHYDWRAEAWQLIFAFGIVLGGWIAGSLFANPEPVAIAQATQADLRALGLTDLSGLVPPELMRWETLLTLPGFVMIVVGGFFVGFGARYAGGCTSGHGITGVADLQVASFVAVFGFYVGGSFSAFVILPFLV